MSLKYPSLVRTYHSEYTTAGLIVESNQITTIYERYSNQLTKNGLHTLAEVWQKKERNNKERQPVLRLFVHSKQLRNQNEGGGVECDKHNLHAHTKQERHFWEHYRVKYLQYQNIRLAGMFNKPKPFHLPVKDEMEIYSVTSPPQQYHQGSELGIQPLDVWEQSDLRYCESYHILK